MKRNGEKSRQAIKAHFFTGSWVKTQKPSNNHLQKCFVIKNDDLAKIFATSEVARQIFNFFRLFFITPLKKELEEHHQFILAEYKKAKREDSLELPQHEDWVKRIEIEYDSGLNFEQFYLLQVLESISKKPIQELKFKWSDKHNQNEPLIPIQMIVSSEKDALVNADYHTKCELGLIECLRSRKSPSKNQFIRLVGWLRTNHPDFTYLKKINASMCEIVAEKVHDNMASFLGLKTKADDKTAKKMRSKIEGEFTSFYFKKPKIYEVDGVDYCELKLADDHVLKVRTPKYGQFYKNSPEKSVSFASIAGSAKFAVLSQDERLGQEGHFTLSFMFDPEHGKDVKKKNENLPEVVLGVVETGVEEILFLDKDENSQSFKLSQIANDVAKKHSQIDARLKPTTTGSKAWTRRMKARQKLSSKQHNVQTDNLRKIASGIAKLLEQKLSEKVHGVLYVSVPSEGVRLGQARDRKKNKKEHRQVQNTGYNARFITYLTNALKKIGVMVVKKEGICDGRLESAQALLQS